MCCFQELAQIMLKSGLVNPDHVRDILQSKNEVN